MTTAPGRGNEHMQEIYRLQDVKPFVYASRIYDISWHTGKLMSSFIHLGFDRAGLGSHECTWTREEHGTRLIEKSSEQWQRQLHANLRSATCVYRQ